MVCLLVRKFSLFSWGKNKTFHFKCGRLNYLVIINQKIISIQKKKTQTNNKKTQLFLIKKKNITPKKTRRSAFKSLAWVNHQWNGIAPAASLNELDIKSIPSVMAVRFGQSPSDMFNVGSACTSYARTTYGPNR